MQELYLYQMISYTDLPLAAKCLLKLKLSGYKSFLLLGVLNEDPYPEICSTYYLQPYKRRSRDADDGRVEDFDSHEVRDMINGIEFIEFVVRIPHLAISDN